MRFDIDWHRRAEQIELEGAPSSTARTPMRFRAADGDRQTQRRSVLARIAACDAADVDAAVSAARRSFESGQWSEAHPGYASACSTNWSIGSRPTGERSVC